MQISVSSTLTVYHDGQFWVGLAEHVEGGRYGVARIVFGAESSDEEILRFVVGKWEKLSFFGGEPTEASKPAKNPKRRAREAAKALKQPAMSTKAQQALAAQREAMKQESAHARSRRRVDANGDGYARARTRHRTSQLVSQVFGTHTRRSKCGATPHGSRLSRDALLLALQQPHDAVDVDGKARPSLTLVAVEV